MDADCICGHSAELHLYPNSKLFGDCHECRCELYNPPGGLKGVPVHPLFAFTEDEFRMVSCSKCHRFRVLPIGICESCRWDNGAQGMVEEHEGKGLKSVPAQTRISPSAMSEVHAALEEYCAVVENSLVSPRTQAMYIDNANNFVRWLKFDFAPGYRKDPYPLRKQGKIAS